MLVTLLLAIAGTLVVDLEPSAAPGRPAATQVVQVVTVPKTVDVGFVRNGKLVRVERTVPRGVAPRLHALRELTQGPTRDERARGLRTAIRPGVRLRSLRSGERMWLASFSRSLFGPGSAETVRRRLAQITWTLSRLGGPQEYAAISAEGRLATVLRLGVRPGAWRAAEGEKSYLVQHPRNPAPPLAARIPLPRRRDRLARLRDLTVPARVSGMGRALSYRHGDRRDAGRPR